MSDRLRRVITADVRNLPYEGERDLRAKPDTSQTITGISRRGFIAGAVTTTVAAAALGQTRDYTQNSTPQRYPDRDIVVLDPRFGKYKIGNAGIQRLYTGMAWAEGPAWSCAVVAAGIGPTGPVGGMPFGRGIESSQEKKYSVNFSTLAPA